MAYSEPRPDVGPSLTAEVAVGACSVRRRCRRIDRVAAHLDHCAVASCKHPSSLRYSPTLRATARQDTYCSVDASILRPAVAMLVTTALSKGDTVGVAHRSLCHRCRSQLLLDLESLGVLRCSMECRLCRLCLRRLMFTGLQRYQYTVAVITLKQCISRCSMFSSAFTDSSLHLRLEPQIAVHDVEKVCCGGEHARASRSLQ